MIPSILTSSRFLKRGHRGSLFLWLGLLTPLVASEAVSHCDPPGNSTLPLRPIAKQHQYQFGYQLQFEFFKYNAWAEFDLGFEKVPVKPTSPFANVSSGPFDSIPTKSTTGNRLGPTAAPNAKPAQEEPSIEANANTTAFVVFLAQPENLLCLHADPGEVNLRGRLKSNFRARQLGLQLALNRERDLKRMAELQIREDRLTAWEADLKLREMGFFEPAIIKMKAYSTNVTAHFPSLPTFSRDTAVIKMKTYYTNVKAHVPALPTCSSEAVFVALKAFSANVRDRVPSLAAFSSEGFQTTITLPPTGTHHPSSSFQAVVVALKAFSANLWGRVPSLPTIEAALSNLKTYSANATASSCVFQAPVIALKAFSANVKNRIIHIPTFPCNATTTCTTVDATLAESIKCDLFLLVLAILGKYLAQAMTRVARLCRALAPSYLLNKDFPKLLRTILPGSLVQLTLFNSSLHQSHQPDAACPLPTSSLDTAGVKPRTVLTARPPASPAEKKRASAPKDGTAAVKKAQMKKRRRAKKPADGQEADESDSDSEEEPEKTPPWYSVFDGNLLGFL